MAITDKHKKIIEATICPYCDSSTKIVSETDVYGREYSGRKMIVCSSFPECDSYVGCHSDGRPLGRLANKELREAKKEAHLWFDRIWKSKIMKRKEAYKWLSTALNIPEEYTHIGMFKVETCKRVAELSKEFLNSNI